MSQPQLQASELIERLNALLRQEERTEFEFAQLKRDARELLPADAFHAYIALGIVACLEGDIPNCRNNHLRAIRIQNDALANKQYANSLCNLGLMLEAQTYFDRAYSQEQDDYTLVAYMIKAAYTGLQFHRAAELLGDWQKLTGEAHPQAHEIEGLRDFLDHLQLTDADLQPVVAVIGEMQERDYYRLSRPAIRIIDEGDRWLSVTYPMYDADIPALIDKNMQLAQQITERASTTVLNHIVIKFDLHKSYADRAA